MKNTNISGTYVNNLTGDIQYQSFKPASLFSIKDIDADEELIVKLINTNNLLARLDEASKHIENTDLYISMYVRKEALLSSIIEGTQCTLEDVLDPHVAENANKDIEDVINYVKALNYAVEGLKELPLCNKLLKKTHAILLSGVRGNDKNPGEFRKSQNWIGSGSSTIKNARYVPPNVEDMNNAMIDLEKYINTNKGNEFLLSASLIHYQFETIHPFLDGNGRIGRLLVLLYLLDKKVITKPIIYISYFLKMHQSEYYDRMSEVRRTGNYLQWTKFFLDSLATAAMDSLETIDEIDCLYKKNLELVTKYGKNTIKLFNYLQQYPIIEIKKTAKDLDVTFNTVSKAVNNLVYLNILKKTNNNTRNKVFVYSEYLNILKEGIN